MRITITNHYFKSEKRRFEEIHAGIDFSYDYFDYIKFFETGEFIWKSDMSESLDFASLLKGISPDEIAQHKNHLQDFNYKDYISGRWKHEDNMIVMDWSIEGHPPPAKGFNPYRLYIEWLDDDAIRDNMGWVYRRVV